MATLLPIRSGGGVFIRAVTVSSFVLGFVVEVVVVVAVVEAGVGVREALTETDLNLVAGAFSAAAVVRDVGLDGGFL